MSAEIDISIRPVLGVEAARRYKRLSWSWLAVLDLVIIGGFIGFIHADLIFAPGKSIELPQSSEAESRRVEAVLSVQGTLYLFDGRIFRREGIALGFSDYFKRNPRMRGVSTLLVKMDAQAPLNALLEVCEAAQGAGFQAVHIAENTNQPEAIPIFQ